MNAFTKNEFLPNFELRFRFFRKFGEKIHWHGLTKSVKTFGFVQVT